MNVQGRVFKYGDNVDTDVIIPQHFKLERTRNTCNGGHRLHIRRTRITW